MYNITRLYSDNLPKKKYNLRAFENIDNLHWGQRKLLLSEVEFLTNYYDSYDEGEKYLVYIGSAPGDHINYLSILFPEIKMILYDSVKHVVKSNKNITIFERYFTNDDAENYKDMNIFMMSDIRGLDIKEHRKAQNETGKDVVIMYDMDYQKKWYNIMKPKKALLKFRVSWNEQTTEYFDGDLYIQPWNGNDSVEMRLVPNGQTKIWNNKKIEEGLFYHNTITRRTKLSNNDDNCIRFYYDNLAEILILTNYVKKFCRNTDINDDVENFKIFYK